MPKLTGNVEKRPQDWRRRAVPAAPRAYEPRQVFATPLRAYVSAKAVGSFVPRLTQKAFERYGFSAATLLTDWALIVGRDVAEFTVPERLKWPRDAAPDEDGGGAPTATLVLRVDPARALDIEYRRRHLIERVNGYFGYRAVADLRLVQAPVSRPAAPKSAATRPAARAPDPAVGSGDSLSDALARLAAAVTGRVPPPRTAA